MHDEVNYSQGFFVQNFVFFMLGLNKIYDWPWVPNLATKHAVIFRLNQWLLEYVIKPKAFV